MKKNLISIIILALLVVNVVLTAIMMFSVTSASRKTATLVDNIATALELELTAASGEEEVVEAIPMENIVVYDIAESMTIPLQTGEDGKSHFVLVSASFSINTEDEGYKTYGSDLTGQESLIKDKINTVFSKYTMEEAKVNQEQIRQEILDEVQKLFDSEFIFNVAFSEIVYQ